MGYPLAPVLANFFIGHYEKLWLSELHWSQGRTLGWRCDHSQIADPVLKTGRLQRKVARDSWPHGQQL